MTDTATPETGPVDAPASNDSIAAEILATVGEEAPADAHDEIVQELVNEAESDGGEPSQEEPAAEDDATDPAEEAGDPEEGPQPEAEQLVTVKVNGEDREVPLSEALAGYSRLEDYKAKTAEVAEQRRELEAKTSTIEADVKAHYANQLEQATQIFLDTDPVLQEAKRIDWAQLKATDPAAFVAWQDTVNARVQLFEQTQQKAATARQEALQHQSQQTQREQAQRFDHAADEIVKAMPELADEAKFQAFASDAISTLKESGFAPEEIAGVLDHRVLTLADEARQWRAHKAAQASLPAKKIVQKSAVKPLTTDGEGSRASKPRFPANASRQAQQNWLVNQFLSEP